MSETTEQFHALAALKKNMHLLVELESSEALAAITVKMVDVVESLINNKLDQAVKDLWACSYAIQRTIYLSLSEMLKKKSHVWETSAVADAENGNYQQATLDYCRANAEITKGCGYNALFLEFNDES